MLPVVCFIGNSGAGKTTLIENIVPELKYRGYRIAVIKHTPHGFNIDRKGKDSWRFSHAGADIVVLSSKDRLCMIQQVVEESPLEDILSTFEGKVDLVLVEGYKRSSWPTIEVVRYSVNPRLIHSPEELLAIVSDRQFPLDMPQFFFEDVKDIANFIIEQMNRGALFHRVGKVGADSLEG